MRESGKPPLFYNPPMKALMKLPKKPDFPIATTSRECLKKQRGNLRQGSAKIIPLNIRQRVVGRVVRPSRSAGVLRTRLERCGRDAPEISTASAPNRKKMVGLFRRNDPNQRQSGPGPRMKRIPANKNQGRQSFVFSPSAPLRLCARSRFRFPHLQLRASRRSAPTLGERNRGRALLSNSPALTSNPPPCLCAFV